MSQDNTPEHPETGNSSEKKDLLSSLFSRGQKFIESLAQLFSCYRFSDECKQVIEKQQSELQHYGDSYSSLRSLDNEQKELEEKLREAQKKYKQKEADLTNQHSKWNDAIQQSETLKKELEVVKEIEQYSESFDFHKYLYLPPLTISDVTGKVEQCHSEIRDFVSIPDEKYDGNGIIVHAELFCFHDSSKFKASIHPVTEAPTSWQIVIGDTAVIHITIQNKRIQVEWDENLKLKSGTHVNALLFSVLKFTFAATVTTEQGKKETAIEKSLYCQLFTPGRFSVVPSEHVNIREARGNKPIHKIAEVHCNGLEFFENDSDLNKWLEDIIHAEGEFFMPNYRGNANFAPCESEKFPMIVLQVDSQEKIPPDLKNAQMTVSLYNKDSGVELILFKQDERTASQSTELPEISRWDETLAQ